MNIGGHLLFLCVTVRFVCMPQALALLAVTFLDSRCWGGCDRFAQHFAQQLRYKACIGCKRNAIHFRVFFARVCKTRKRNAIYPRQVPEAVSFAVTYPSPRFFDAHGGYGPE